MSKSEYQLLRWSVESHINLYVSDADVARSLCNEIMRTFVQSLSASQIKQASGKRAFRTFRRDAKVIPPSWAFSKPGISSRLPSL